MPTIALSMRPERRQTSWLRSVRLVPEPIVRVRENPGDFDTWQWSPRLTTTMAPPLNRTGFIQRGVSAISTALVGAFPPMNSLGPRT